MTRRLPRSSLCAASRGVHWASGDRAVAAAPAAVAACAPAAAICRLHCALGFGLVLRGSLSLALACTERQSTWPGRGCLLAR